MAVMLFLIQYKLDWSLSNPARIASSFSHTTLFSMPTLYLSFSFGPLPPPPFCWTDITEQHTGYWADHLPCNSNGMSHARMQYKLFKSRRVLVSYPDPIFHSCGWITSPATWGVWGKWSWYWKLCNRHDVIANVTSNEVLVLFEYAVLICRDDVVQT